jgi:hypothetical protein
MRLLIMISEFSVSNEKNVFIFKKWETENDEDDNKRDDKSTINAFIPSIKLVSESSSE